MQQLALRHAVQHSLAGTFGVGDIVNVLPNDDVGIVRGEVMKLRESFNVYKVEYPPVVERADATALAGAGAGRTACGSSSTASGSKEQRRGIDARADRGCGSMPAP